MLLQPPTPHFITCSTPSRSPSYHSVRSHQPLNSSPLASPSCSSPTQDVQERQERRRAQFKSLTPASASHRSPFTPAAARFLFRSSSQASEDPQKVFLRERFQARCREHAQKLRQQAVSSRRSSDMCSDVFMDCDDEDESDDVIIQDELFRRIVQRAKNKTNHSYRVSYALEVGSSFDPDMEDASLWESELQGQISGTTEPTPDDLEEEELLEYAEQCAALADFADLDFSDDPAEPSDLDDIPFGVLPRTSQPRETRRTNEMDVS